MDDLKKAIEGLSEEEANELLNHWWAERPDTLSHWWAAKMRQSVLPEEKNAKGA